jgi:hypothetical protein
MNNGIMDSAAQALPGLSVKTAPTRGINRMNQARPGPGIILPQPAQTLNALPGVPWSLHFINRITFGATQEFIEATKQHGFEAILEWQLNHLGIDDGGLEDLLYENLPTLGATPQELIANEEFQMQAPGQLITASLFRQSFSPRQLFERMVEFWNDHFNVSIFDGPVRFLKTVEDREIMRPLALTRFRDILHANAKSPAMLYYLDNYSNTYLGPNENYARELMELHTLGVDGGYTEQDVLEVSRALTGWTIRRREGTFQFNALAHDHEEKTVLGVTIPAGGGVSDGETVLDILADHPSTARFISYKLARRFVSDQPPESLVNKLAATFTATDGHIPSLLRTLFTASEFWQNRETKTKRPIDFINSTLRTLGLEADQRIIRFITSRLEALAQIPFGWHAPNGYADVAGYWTNTSALINRWNTINAAVFETSAENVTTWMGDAASPSEIIDVLSEAALHRQISPSDKTTLLESIFSTLPPDAPLPAQTLEYYGRVVLIALLSSRHFQLR